MSGNAVRTPTTAAKSEAMSFGPTLRLQRKCACGGNTDTLSGECEECKTTKLIGAHSGLAEGGGNDHPEREAAEVGVQVNSNMRQRNGSSSPPQVQQLNDGRSDRGEVPSIVHEVMRSPGQPLDTSTRTLMEPRFGHDLSHVRIHTDALAATSARSVGAKAYTVGHRIAFSSGNYRPRSNAGLSLLAHEIAHVLQSPNGVQSTSTPWQISQPGDASELAADRAALQVSRGQATQVATSGDAATVARSPEQPGWMETADEWWGKKKEDAYDSLIDGIRSLKRSGLAELRDLARELPASLQPIAEILIEQVETCCDLVISLGLAIVGIVVGLVSGIAHAIWGLLSMLEGAMEGLILFVAGFFSARYRDEFDEKANALLNGLKNLPANLQALWNAWQAKFNTASAERQSLMIGELTGQIEAILLATMAGGSAANAAPKLSIAPIQQFALAGGRATAGGGAMAIDLAGPGAGMVFAVNVANQIDDKAKAAGKKNQGQKASQTAAKNTNSDPIKVKEPEIPEDTHGLRKTPGGMAVGEGKEVGNFVHGKGKIFEKLKQLIPTEPNVTSGEVPPDAIPEYPVKRQGYSPGREPRIDRLDRAGHTVIEIKPHGLYDQGLAEAQVYAQDMDKLEPLANGEKWLARCVTYDYDLVYEYLKRIGFLSE